MNVRFTAAAAGIALAIASAGCGHSLPSTTSVGTLQSPQGAAPGRMAATGRLSVTPGALSFTTKPKLNLRVSESGYTGAFSVATSNRRVAKVGRAGHGPGPVGVAVTSVGAGSAVLTIGDNHGGKVRIKVTVTSGVVVVQ